MLKELVRLANALDQRGLQKEADALDSIIQKSAASWPTDDYDFFDFIDETRDFKGDESWHPSDANRDEAKEILEFDPAAFFIYRLHKSYPDLGEKAVHKIKPGFFFSRRLDKDYPDLAQEFATKLAEYPGYKREYFDLGLHEREEFAEVTKKAAISWAEHTMNPERALNRMEKWFPTTVKAIRDNLADSPELLEKKPFRRRKRQSLG